MRRMKRPSPIRSGYEPEIPIEVRKAVLERAHANNDYQFGICENCGYETRLELHHRTYQRFDSYKRLEEPIFGFETPDDLDALCRICHHAKHIDFAGKFWGDIDAMNELWEPFFWALEKDD